MAGGGLDDQPSATTLRVEELVERAWRGRVRVPHFQRDFRWTRDDVIKLFDSILKGYPIGSLLLWRRPAPARRLQLGALRIDAEATDSALWVVDGQQRIVSLANALHPGGGKDPRFNIAYDMQAGEFVPGTPNRGPAVIPLPVLFDLRQILGWFSRYRDFEEYAEQAHEVTTRLRQYSIPVYEFAQGDVRVLEDIFVRMNSYGKRLRRSEVFSVFHAGDEREEADSRISTADIADRIDNDTGFGVIDDDTVLRAVLARRGPDVMRELRTEFTGPPAGLASTDQGRAIVDFPLEDRNTAFREGAVALGRAVVFLQNTAGVPHFSMVAYRYLLVVLARLFAHHPEPDSRNLRLLRRWYWRAAVVGPEVFTGGTIGAIRTFAGAVQPRDLTGSVQGLLGLVPRGLLGLVPPVPDLKQFRSDYASTKMALCAWWAKKPRSVETGEPFTHEDLSGCLLEMPTAGDAIRPILSRADVPYEYRGFAANSVLMPYVESDSPHVLPLFLQRPPALEPERHEAAVRSHFITPEVVDGLADHGAAEFLRRRQVLLEDGLHDFLEIMCEWGFEDTPPLEELLVPDPKDDADDPD